MLFGDFRTFDERTAMPFAEDLAQNFGDMAEFFGASYLGRSLREGIVENRRNLIVAGYALTRMEELGLCGDRAVDVCRRTVEGRQLQTMSGAVLQRYDPIDVYVTVPERFERVVAASHFENGVDILRGAVRRLRSCDSPIRIVLEYNLTAYTRGREPVPWDPDDPRMFRLINGDPVQ
jgi:hypothetical protein